MKIVVNDANILIDLCKLRTLITELNRKLGLPKAEYEARIRDWRL